MRDAIQRLIGERAAAFRDLEAALDLQDCEWRTPPCGVLLTDTLPLADARALFLAIAGGDPAALTPVLIGEEGLRPDYFAMARISELDAALERHTASATASPDDPFRAQAEEIERTRAHLTGLCDRIAAQLGRPIDDVLGRLDVDALAAFEDGDDEELEPDEDPEVDPAAVYARALAERRAFVEHAKKAYPGTPVRVDPLRAFDLASALDEIALGPARVAVVDCAPHLAPLYLGFGTRPGAHPRVWARWAERWGARPIAFDQASLYGFVARPPATVREHIDFFAEQAAYNPDTRADGPLAQLGAGYRNALVGFWWD